MAWPDRPRPLLGGPRRRAAAVRGRPPRAADEGGRHPVSARSFPFTGPLALLETEHFRRLELRPSERNAAGGRLARPIAVVRGDAPPMSAQAQAEVKR
jgi:hypothetical protein